jgi:haloalkane dehalogenase
MRSLKDDPHYSLPAKIMNTWVGKFLYLKMNFPVNVIMPSAYGNKKLLTKKIHKHYKNAISKGYRTAAYVFATEIINASSWWQQLADHLQVLQHMPFLFFWGLRDSFVPAKELEIWKTKLPEAKVIIFPDAGHFVHEEKPDAMIDAIKEFMKEKSLPGKLNPDFFSHLSAKNPHAGRGH